MSRLPTRYNFGSEVRNLNNQLYNQLVDMFGKTSDAVNGKVNKYATDSSPPASDQINQEFDIGDIWVRTDTNTAWIMTSRTTAKDVTWTQIT